MSRHGPLRQVLLTSAPLQHVVYALFAAPEGGSSEKSTLMTQLFGYSCYAPRSRFGGNAAVQGMHIGDVVDNGHAEGDDVPHCKLDRRGTV